MSEPRRLVAVYDYTDAEGEVLFQTCRWEPKGFCQRRPARKDDPPERVKRGNWVYTTDGITPVLYRLPEVVAAPCVIVVEGEKDADRIMSLGIRNVAATCNPMGAGKWRHGYSTTLQGKSVVIIPDNDPPGREHAEDVRRSCVGIAKRERIVDLPSLEEKQDVSDWLETHTAAEFVDLLKTVPAAPAQQGDEAALLAVALSGCSDARAAGEELSRRLRARGVLS